MRYTNRHFTYLLTITVSPVPLIITFHLLGFLCKNHYTECALAAVQCIVIGPVC